MKEKVDEVVKKLKGDDKLLEKFQKNPVKTVEGIIGVDLPDDQINGIVEAVKAKIGGAGVVDKIKGLLG